MTFVPEHLREFFGDTPFVDRDGHINIYKDGMFDINWVWGSRHYWYSISTTLLFILSIINAALWIGKMIEQEEKNNKK